MPTITSQRMNPSLWGGLLTGATAMLFAFLPVDVVVSVFYHYYFPPEQMFWLHEIILPGFLLAVAGAFWLCYAIASPLRVAARRATSWACLKHGGGMEQDTFEAAYWVGAGVACGALMLASATTPLIPILNFMR